MSAILIRFFEIALCRKGPQDLPGSQFMLGLAIGINLVTFALVIGLTTTPDWWRGAAQAAAGLVSEAAFIWLVLSLYNKRARFVQTLTAVIGVDSVINVVSIPLLASMPPETLADAVTPLQGLLLLVLLVWGVAALGCILRHAVNVPLFAGVTLSLLFHIGFYSLSASLF